MRRLCAQVAYEGDVCRAEVRLPVFEPVLRHVNFRASVRLECPACGIPGQLAWIRVDVYVFSRGVVSERAAGYRRQTASESELSAACA